MDCRWANLSDCPEELADFFIANVVPEYISHGEIQDGRADGPGKWSETLRTTLINQFSLACAKKGDGVLPETRVAVATSSQASVAGIGYIGVQDDATNSYAVLYDLIIRSDSRGNGVGTHLLKWIEERLRIQNIKFLFLESGVNNYRAHDFFKASKFEAVSVSFMKSL